MLANSGNTKCRPFQVNINCSKFIIDRLQQRRWCHVTFLSYLFVTLTNSWFGVFLPRKIITILRKIAVNFRQVSLKGVLVSVSILQCFGKIFKKYLWKRGIFKNPLLYRNFFASDFKVFQQDFFHLFTYPPLIYRSLFVLYMPHILRIQYSCLEKCYFPIFTIPEIESKIKINLVFWICRLIWSIYLICIIIQQNFLITSYTFATS